MARGTLEAFVLPEVIAIVVPRRATALAAQVFTARDVTRAPDTPPPRVA